jgi:hypothetical protein
MCVVPVKQQATNSFTNTPRAHRDYYINYFVRSALARSTGYSSGSSTRKRAQCIFPTRLRPNHGLDSLSPTGNTHPHHGQNGKAWTTGKPSTSTRRCWTRPSHASMQLPLVHLPSRPSRPSRLIRLIRLGADSAIPSALTSSPPNEPSAS